MTLQTVDTAVDTAVERQEGSRSDVSQGSEAVRRPKPAATVLPPPLPLLGALIGSVAASACGGGGGGAVNAFTAAEPAAIALAAPPPTGSSSSAPNAQVKAAAQSADVFTSDADVVRLLAQGGFGGNRAEVDRVFKLGRASAWIDEQLGMKRSVGHQAWFREQGWDPAKSLDPGGNGLDYTVWRAFITNEDQLRQRMVYALSQILVVSSAGLDGARFGWLGAYYLDVLDEHAFGTFRALLEAVTLSPAMGRYLSMKGSQKGVPNGRQPDENYAREIMQLFTIGLVKLHADGTPRLVAGSPLDSYTETDVAALARVFTGWDEITVDAGKALRFVTPLVNTESLHDKDEKKFLGITLAAGQSAAKSLSDALDHLCNHANVGPFIGKQLIQRLVTSNPSRAYVARVSAVFKDNGVGVRGDLKAVLRAILTDDEARKTGAALAGANRGKLREPVLRFVSWARACDVNSASQKWALGSLALPATRLGQSPLHATSVFNFYRPGYVPPNSAFSRFNDALLPDSGGPKVAPEFQITTETSVAGYLNFMQAAVSNVVGLGWSDVKAKYGPAWIDKAVNPSKLADEANVMLAAGQLSEVNLNLIRETVNQMPMGTAASELNRVYAAVFLTLAAPECLVAK